MKISEEEYKKALLIVLQYESEISKKTRENSKRNNYVKSIDTVFSTGLTNLLSTLDSVDNLGIDSKMTVAEFILLNIDWERYFIIRNFGNVRKKELRNFIKEYQIK